MSATNPDIFVKLWLSPTTEDGRHTPIRSGEYRGVLGINSKYFSVRWLVAENSELVPGGEPANLGVQFLDPEIASAELKVGAKFTVWEGRTIGHGQVTEIAHHA